MNFSQKLNQIENDSISKTTFSEIETQKNHSINNSIYISEKKFKKFESPKHFYFPIINQIKAEIIIEWREGEKELLLVGSLDNFDKFFLSKKNKKMNIY